MGLVEVKAIEAVEAEEVKTSIFLVVAKKATSARIARRRQSLPQVQADGTSIVDVQGREAKGWRKYRRGIRWWIWWRLMASKPTGDRIVRSVLL